MAKVTPCAEKRQPLEVAPSAALGDPITVRGKLALLGWVSISDWAAAHGYERRMASYCIRTWANRTDRRPHGGIARSLMRDLHQTIATSRRPPSVTVSEC